jgi:hypothetical protein
MIDFFKKLVFALPAFMLSSGLWAQPGYRVFDFVDPSLKTFTVSGQLGVASYFGDLCPTEDCYTKVNRSAGIGVNLRMNDYFFFNFNALHYRISGSDALSGNESRLRRNLSFRADNYEFSLVGNFEFLNYNTFRYLTRKEFPISVFSFIGFGITTNNPEALYKGNYVKLRPLMTEQVSYSAVAPVIPFGLGVGYKLNDKFSFSFTSGYRYCFSDYLDDISTSYADQNSFSDPVAFALQYRGPAGKTGTRGNPKSKDGYFIMSVKAEYKIPNMKFLNLLGMRRGQSGGSGGPKGGGVQPGRKAAKRRNSK